MRPTINFIPGSTFQACCLILWDLSMLIAPAKSPKTSNIEARCPTNRRPYLILDPYLGKTIIGMVEGGANLTM